MWLSGPLVCTAKNGLAFQLPCRFAVCSLRPPLAGVAARGTMR